MLTTLLANSTINISDGLQEYSVQPVETSLTPIIADVVNGVVLIAALAFLVFLLLGAISWVTAGGDKGKIEGARNKIVQAAVGLGLAVFAYAIYLFVIDYLGINLGQVDGGGSGPSEACVQGKDGVWRGANCLTGPSSKAIKK